MPMHWLFCLVVLEHGMRYELFALLFSLYHLYLVFLFHCIIYIIYSLFIHTPRHSFCVIAVGNGMCTTYRIPLHADRMCKCWWVLWYFQGHTFSSTWGWTVVQTSKWYCAFRRNFRVSTVLHLTKIMCPFCLDFCGLNKKYLCCSISIMTQTDWQ